jgi:hypothetical protein
VANTIVERLKSTQAVVGAVIAILAFADRAKDILEPVTRLLPTAYQVFVFPALLIAAIALILRAFFLSSPVRSRLVRPEALRLQRENRDHLIGRTEEIERLIRLASGSPLLFIVGESGVGKSALLGAGLVPKLAARGALLPVYIDSLSGPDWEEDAWRLLFLALQPLLPKEQRTAAGLHLLPGPDKRKQVLESLQSATAKTPLIIIDQFDDYQARHWTRFQDHGSWVKAADIIAQNSFWSAMAALARDGKLHLAIATRSDTALGLESVRFVEPETYMVPRLEKEFIGQLLNSITQPGTDSASAVIENPEAGWTDLRDRLIDDLGRTGAVLPQQLKVALLGLATLPRQILSVGAYERAGRTAGLEANWIAARIKRAEQSGGLTEAQTLGMLSALVDPEDPRKTRDLPIDALAREAGVDGDARSALAATLIQLESDEVVRRRRDPGNTADLWRLDHDYIAGVVREAQRRANLWAARLKEGQDALAAAGRHPARWWNALLKPAIQLRFLWDRARGQFHYSPYGRYALQSSARFLPFLAVILAAASTFWYVRQQEQARQFADAIVAPFDGDASLSSGEISALLQLAQASDREAARVLDKLVSSPLYLSRMHEHLAYFSRAMHWAEPARGRSAARQLDAALARYGTDGEQLFEIGTALGQVATWLPDESAERIVRQLLAAMERHPNEPRLNGGLGGAVGAFAERISPDLAADAAMRLLAAMNRPIDTGQIFPLKDSFVRVAERLSPEQAAAVARLMAQRLAANPDETPAFPFLDEQLRALAGNLPPRQAAEIAGLLTAAMNREPTAAWTGRMTLVDLAKALGALGDRLPPREANQAIARLVTELNRTQDPSELARLAVALGALGNHLPRPLADEVAARLMAATPEAATTNIAELVEGLDALRDQLSDARASEVMQWMAAWMIHPASNYFAVSQFGQGLGTFAARAPDRQVRAIAVALVTTMTRNAQDAGMLSHIGLGLGTLNAQDAEILSHIGLALGTLGDRLPPDQANRAATLLVAAAAHSADPGLLTRLRLALSAIGGRLPPERAAALRAQIEARLARTFEPAEVASLTGAVIGLNADLSRERRIEQIFQALADPLAIDATEKALERLGSLAQRPFRREQEAYSWLAARQQAGELQSIDLDAITTRIRAMAVMRLAAIRAIELRPLTGRMLRR